MNLGIKLETIALKEHYMNPKNKGEYLVRSSLTIARS